MSGFFRRSVPVFLPGEAEGALPNGTRVVKSRMEDGDAHPVGALGVVRSSHGPIEAPDSGLTEYGYFVAWDDAPELPVFTRGTKLRRAP